MSFLFVCFLVDSLLDALDLVYEGAEDVPVGAGGAVLVDHLGEPSVVRS